jgi:hypothetical protein
MRGLAALLVSMALGGAASAQTPAPPPEPSAAGSAAEPPVAPAEPSPAPAVPGEPAAPAPPPPAPPPPPPPAAEAAPPQPPPPEEPPRPRRYGDRGTSEIGIGLGYSSLYGFGGGASFRYFVVDGVAPGLEGSYISGGSSGLAYGMAVAALRLVPVRTGNIALVLTGRAGRMFMADHVDGWLAGGAGGVIYMFSGGLGLEVGLELMRLLPASFCADLRSCVILRPIVGFRLAF